MGQLCLTRKKNEKIIVGEKGKEGTITVLEIRGDKVKLGFDFPRDVPVNREEVLSREDNAGIQES